MDDDFLYRAPPPMREAFVEELRQRLEARRPDAHGRKRARIVALLMAIAIVAACAREIWRPHYAQVGELWVLEVSRVREGEYQFFESSGQSQYVEPEMLQLESALALLPYELQLPSRVPEGFALEMEPGFYPPGYPLWSLGLEWTNSAGQRIDLWAATDEISFAAIEAPRGAWKKVDLGGIPAVLLRGAWPEPRLVPTPDEFGLAETVTEWDELAGTQLIWMAGGGHFELRTYGDYVRESDLLRMAESMIE